MNRFLVASLFPASVCLSACGGGVGPSPADDSAAGKGMTADRATQDDPSTDALVPSTPTPTPGCSVKPGADVATGTASCDVARSSFVVDVLGLTWVEPALAWKVGGRARFDVRYTNRSETRSIHYPGMLVASSDARTRTDTEAHGDGVVHPDLYALAACTASLSRDHGFEVLSEMPSGTRVTFTMFPAVATGNGINGCDGTLAQKTVTVTVP